MNLRAFPAFVLNSSFRERRRARSPNPFLISVRKCVGGGVSGLTSPRPRLARPGGQDAGGSAETGHLTLRASAGRPALPPSLQTGKQRLRRSQDLPVSSGSDSPPFPQSPGSSLSLGTSGGAGWGDEEQAQPQSPLGGGTGFRNHGTFQRPLAAPPGRSPSSGGAGRAPRALTEHARVGSML